MQPSYTLANARFGISDVNDRFSLEFWARNVFDEEYGQIMFDVPLRLGASGPTQGAFLGDPHTYGVTLRARWAGPQGRPPPPRVQTSAADLEPAAVFFAFYPLASCACSN